ncbi:ornithine carbamoyltransferase [Paenibacillus baekrokdamisoli]|uniref:Ornithine carbamoyltransferase n=1 Tax=Paenibacillus baekrokdamisoli TaxID=1712516 RepID=A0A3G9IVT6_9BACL|nr:ornithine carbamoyltransferase [Paenibacillus baekrokdamisoli]MBB3072555.1 ornithine carbamoyltransferase [Paenibacillus baekrokdamisoli]BBH22392.1 ornithine carbamoyltransferase [Paenibacillus baekrokdamisoli]
MNHLLSLKEFNKDTLHSIVQKGIEIKNSPEKFYHASERKGLLMLFQKTSTRTNLSFQSAINQMGGYSVAMDWDSSNFSISPIQYEAQYVSRNCDVIMARLKNHSDLLELAKYAKVPVINGCCDKYHPCQALADLMTIYEAAGTFSGITLTYVGILNNVANSLIAGCTSLGIKLLLVTPIINAPSWDEELMQTAFRSGCVENVSSLSEAVSKSDFVYTDAWVDMEFLHESHYEGEKKRRIEQMLPFQLNRKNLNGYSPYIMHDMPIHPGFEIEEELIESERSVIYQQAENRMHAQKSLLLYLLNH